MRLRSRPEVLIVSPNTYPERDIPWVKARGGAHALPPLGSLTVATYMRAQGIDVELLDAERELLTDAETVGRILEIDPARVGWCLWINKVDDVGEMAARLADANPRIGQFAGGPHLSAVPLETMRRYPAFEYGVVGEGERASVEIVRRWREPDHLASVPGIVVRQANTLRYLRDVRRGYTRPPDERLAALARGSENLPTVPVSDALSERDGTIGWPRHASRVERLDDLPIPHYEMLGDLSHYHLSEFTRPAGESQLSMLTSRGCPYACSFCDQEVSGHDWRGLGPARIVEYMEYLRSLGTDYFYLTDDLYLVRLDEVEETARRILESPGLRGASWEAISRTNLVTRAARRRVRVRGRSMNLLELIRLAGCVQLQIAAETGNEELRYQALFKHISNDEIRTSVRQLAGADITVKILNMVGLPGETPENTLETLRFIEELGREGAAYGMISICTPLPTTPLALMIERGTLRWTGDLDDWRKMNLVTAAGIFTTDMRGNEVDYTPAHILMEARGKHRLGAMEGPEDVRRKETIAQKIAGVGLLIDEYRQAQGRRRVATRPPRAEAQPAR